MKTSRLYFMDNLKWFIIWLMVVFHGAMCYMAYAPDWWYVVDKASPSLGATLFVCWADIFIMPVMFFVSGYFGIRSLSRYDMVKFWRGKVKRIILPWVFGAMLIAPWVTYIILASRQSPIGFYEFYTTLFWGALYEQAQYWYLGALTALYGLMVLACQLWPGLKERSESRQPAAGFWLLLTVVGFVSIGLISSYIHPDTWRYFAYILVLQPVRIPSYIVVFFAGAWAWKYRWFEAGGYCPAVSQWGAAFVLAGSFYLWQKFSLPAYGLAAEELVWINAGAQCAFMWSALFFFLGAFKHFFDWTSPFFSALAETSYGVYYLHMPVLFCIAWWFVGLELNVYLKYVCVCVLSLGICFGGSRYVLSRVPSFAVHK